jgi:aspartyl-tRNA(Asn)/glutamyl-tRNA(Gln) amidotransferase subunit B
MEETISLLSQKLATNNSALQLGKTVGNWVLHELGGLQTSSEETFDSAITVTPSELADIIANVTNKQITARVAKQLLSTLSDIPSSAARPSVESLIDEGNLRLRPLSEQEYEALAREIMDENPEMVAAVREKGQKGKVMWFVGQMVRRGEEGTVEPEMARAMVERLFEV